MKIVSGFVMVTNAQSGSEYISIHHTIPEPFFQIGFDFLHLFM
ncbi:conserved hypothetical protein [delta proteobacterium NaphS2]|nr:conserved hypothetical protein [delta proteobacterium NaphS2]